MAGIARDKSTNQKRPKWSRGALGSSGQDAAARFGGERTFGRVTSDLLLFESVAATLDLSAPAVSSFRTCSPCRYIVMLFAVLCVSIADIAEVDVWSGSVGALSAPFGERGRLHGACAV